MSRVVSPSWGLPTSTNGRYQSIKDSSLTQSKTASELPLGLALAFVTIHASAPSESFTPQHVLILITL